jgi:TRAP-type C4-dicarboxylate transport system permease small subunit
MSKGIVAVFNLIHIGMVYVAKFMMVAMVLITFANVVLRYGFNSGIIWSEEVSLLLAVWFIFIAMSLGVKQQLHINITVIPNGLLAPWMRKFIVLLRSLVELSVGYVMLVDGGKLVGITMKSIMPATQWPAGLLYMILPVSAVIMIYESFMDIIGIDTKDARVDEFLTGNGGLKKVLEDSDA